MDGPSLFYSKIAYGKNVFLKKSCLKLKEGTLATCLVWYASLQVGISSASNQEFPYYKFYESNIVSYTIIAFEETLNIALDTTFPLSYL